MGKNLQRVQDMLDGNYGGKTQVGYTPDKTTRKVGDKWKDSDGIEWEQKEGYISQVSKMAKRGIADRCKSCESYCFKPWDKHYYSVYGKCRTCQIEWEEDLKWNKKNRIGLEGNKWQYWKRLQELRNMEAIERDMAKEIDEISRIKNLEDNPFDQSVANALANHEVDTSIKVNKKLTS